MEGLTEYLKIQYEETALKWQNEEGERKRFSELYFNIQNGLETLIGNRNMYITVAMHLAVAEDERRLKYILQKYN